MNVAFFLIPKSQVTWIPIRSTLRRAMQELRRSGSTALPVIDDAGRYAGTVTEGDVLRVLQSVPGSQTARDRGIVVVAPYYPAASAGRRGFA